jgi:hypothetical protein
VKGVQSLAKMIGRGLAKVFGPVVIWFLRAALAVAMVIFLAWAVWTYLFHPGHLISGIKGFVGGLVPHFVVENKTTPLPTAAPPTLPVRPPIRPVNTQLVSKPKARPVHRNKAVLPVSPSAPEPAATTPAVSAQPAPVENGRDTDSAFVLKFAQTLYSIGYLNYDTQEATLLGWVTKDYAGDLKGHYFNPYVRKNMESLHRIKTFTPDGPVKWVSSNETTEEFMISGTIVGQGGWNGQASNYTKTVKAHIQIIHDPSGKILVKNIKEEISE